MSYKQNYLGFSRKSGILMPISSLPSKYGIGGFGKSAYDFVRFLHDTNTKCWQVLPLNPTAYGDSPYQSPASMAGNPYFIDPEILTDKGLLTKLELKAATHNTKRVDYGWLFENRYPVLKKAYSRFSSLGGHKSTEYKKFVRQNASWLSDYALFMSLKEHYSHAAWQSWNEEHRSVASARLEKERFAPACGFWEWVQFEFYTEWLELKKYANSLGILIIGDMPIYVSCDSLDVWQNPEEFLLDENKNPTVVAGCPPDAFSPDGQLWGNPIYNWHGMKERGFEWWCRRVGLAFKLYDILRIDHFRGFAGYYNVPYGNSNAKDGKWDTAPGKELFEAISSRFKGAKIIAEDLGHITPDVRDLLDETGFPGMKLLQFAFDSENSEYLPKNFKSSHCVAYPGSHDSDCTRSWVKSLSGDTLIRFNRECPHRLGQSRALDLVELAMSSIATLAIVPMQDYLGLTGDDGRMNTPAVATGNWTWRISSRYRTDALKERVATMTKRAGRSSKSRD